MELRLLPKISRNLPCDAATLQCLLDNASELLEHHQKGVNEVWATDHISPFVRWGGFLALEGSDSVAIGDRYRLHPREEFTLIFKNFTREHASSGYWMAIGNDSGAATFSVTLTENFDALPGEVTITLSDGSSTYTVSSSGLDLRRHEIIELGVVYDGTDISFFRDGAFVSSGSAVSAPINYAGTMYIGGDVSGSNEINGYLRDWMFWGKAFSSPEMTTYASNHVDPYPDELRISLIFDDGAGIIVADTADPAKWGIEFDDSTETPIYSQDEIHGVDNFTLLGEAYWHENSYSENVILAKGSQFEGHCNYRIAVEKSTKKLKFSYYYSSVWTHVVSDLTVRAGHYCDVAVRLSGSVIEFYVDGVWDTKSIGVDLRTDYYSLVFGYDKGSPNTNNWHGHLRNWGFCQSFLSDVEVTDFFAGSPPSSITAYWTLRNGVGNTFESTVEHNMNDFSTYSAFTIITHEVMQQMPVEGTIFLQVYPDDLASISVSADVLRKQNIPGTTVDYMLYIDSSNRVCMKLVDPSTNNIVSTHTLTDDKWFELIITIRREYVKIRMNGVLYNAIITDAIRNSSTGNIYWGNWGGDAFPGMMRKLKIWDRCLKGDELDKLMYRRIFPVSGLVVDLAGNEGSGTQFTDASTDYRLDV